MPATPNFAGFQEAQARLREQFGHDITFLTEGVDTYPPGTELDPESGEPFDPSIEPTATSDVATVVHCSVVSRPMGLSRSGVDDSVKREAIGWVEEGGVVLIVDIEDWADVRDADSFEYADETYSIRQTEHDYLGEAERYLIFGSQQ